MHIALFVDFHDSSVGGVQTSVRGQRKGLERLGHTVTIVSPPPVSGVNSDPNAICVPAVPLFRPNGFPMVAPSRGNRERIEYELDRRAPIDIIHVQTNMGMGILGVQIAKKRQIPLVQTMHGRDDVFAKSYPFPYAVTLLQRFGHGVLVPHTNQVSRLHDSPTAHNAWQIMVNHAQAADHVIVPSHHFSVKFREHGVTKPINVISNGVDDDVVAQLPKQKRVAPMENTPLRLMWCGRLSAEKRPFDTIRAAVAAKGCTLDLYGDGPMTESVQRYIDSHGIGDRVVLRGRVGQKDILKAMHEHDALVYPSYGFDNQPMVLIEAVAAAIPVIYCDPDLTECMPEGGALLTDDQTVGAIVKAITALQRDVSRRQQMHATMFAYRPKIMQSYHSKKMVDVYKQYISPISTMV